MRSPIVCFGYPASTIPCACESTGCPTVSGCMRRFSMATEVMTRARLAIERDILLNDEQLDALSQKLKQIAFWEMPTRVGTAGLDTDGDQLVLEGVSGRLYHVVDRATPEAGFKDLCRYLLDLTGIRMQDTWEKYHESEARAEIETKCLTAHCAVPAFRPSYGPRRHAILMAARRSRSNERNGHVHTWC